MFGGGGVVGKGPLNAFRCWGEWFSLLIPTRVERVARVARIVGRGDGGMTRVELWIYDGVGGEHSAVRP